MSPLHHLNIFFFSPELRSGVHRGDPIGVPLCTYEHPYGVLIPDPVGVRYHTPTGCDTLRFIFSYRTVSLRLPGSLTTPEGGGTTPFGCGIHKPRRGLCTGPRRGPVSHPNGV